MAPLRPGVIVHAVDPGWVPTHMGGSDAADDLDLTHVTHGSAVTDPQEDAVPAVTGVRPAASPRTPPQTPRPRSASPPRGTSGSAR